MGARGVPTDPLNWLRKRGWARRARRGIYNAPHMRISETHIAHLLRHGYAIVPGFLNASELRAAKANMLQYVPTAEELAATPQRYAWVYDEAEHLQTEFPFAGDALNDVSTHPEIVSFVEK